MPADDITQILERFSLENFEVLSHSGGYLGLNASLNIWPAAILKQITAIKLLDNFYSVYLASTLSTRFDQATLKNICTGYYTDHNQERFASHYKDLCPKVVHKTEHKSSVVDYFTFGARSE